MGRFEDLRRDQFFSIIRSSLTKSKGDGDQDELSDEAWIDLYQHLRLINEKADLIELTTREMVINFVFESLSQDP